jgi:4-amino-4-deoxy-L-arabinose transferase-like glycosyltransferase
MVTRPHWSGWCGRRRLPSWFLPPVILSTAAVAVTFYRSARFAHTPAFFAVLVWIIAGAGVAVIVGLKRSRREADHCQRELDALEK